MLPVYNIPFNLCSIGTYLPSRSSLTSKHQIIIVKSNIYLIHIDYLILIYRFPLVCQNSCCCMVWLATVLAPFPFWDLTPPSSFLDFHRHFLVLVSYWIFLRMLLFPISSNTGQHQLFKMASVLGIRIALVRVHLTFWMP